MFERFFARGDTFALGVCNGCQMMAALKELIPGTETWPKFLRNRSDQFEARLTLVEIVPSPSVLLAGMAGSRIPIVTAHGEGRAEFKSASDLAACDEQLTSMRSSRTARPSPRRIRPIRTARRTASRAYRTPTAA
jgi:phosphoribosylformylglycinamidine (FGAM) synthase-like amidotransferase family enzyme